MSASIEARVLESVRDAPASGGTLMERLKLDVAVYGALHNLAHRGHVAMLAEGPGERVWGVAGALPVRPKDPGLPDSFSLDDENLARVDAQAAAMTRGLPGFYFEEIRRAIVVRADRDGQLDVDVLGRPADARRFLRRVEKAKGAVALRLHRPRWILPLLLIIAAVLLLRVFVVGAYTVPPSSISMAPALFPAAEDGDALVLANLLAREPARGEIWIFAWANRVFVKRVMGLPGETITIADGDLFVDGERWIKERAQLERLAVRSPLGEDGTLSAGYPLPAGGFEHVDADVHDVIVAGRVTARTLPATFTVRLHDGGAGHTLILGLPHGGLSADGVEVEKGLDFGLEAGLPVEFWVTNADGCLRVELDGREVARVPVARRGPKTGITITTQGDVVHDTRTYRDVDYVDIPGAGRWEIGGGTYMMLGDNSANSMDSRQLGPIPQDALKGRVWGVAWPPGRIRLVR